MEESFNDFESHVLPLLKRYDGKLLYRVRPTKNCIVEAVDQPYEIHIISFPSKTDFESYLNDKERAEYATLKEQSVEKILLIEGKLI